MQNIVAAFRTEEPQQEEPMDVGDSSSIGRMGNATNVKESLAPVHISDEILPPAENSTALSEVDPSRSETASPTTDLTGSWQLVVTNAFKQQYEKYLKLLGQPKLVRSVAISIIGMTTEETRQDENGRSLWIKGTNPRGVWERILVSNSVDDDQQYEIQTIDKETVQAEAWWEEGGSRHRSWLKGVSKYGGGSFESLRYLDGPDILVCESTFHPTDAKREPARVTWRFARTSQS